jgi:hypothetical protein
MSNLKFKTMKYLQHKNRNGFIILDNEGNLIVSFELHNQGVEISQLIFFDINEYYERDKEFVLSQYRVALETLNEIKLTFPT